MDTSRKRPGDRFSPQLNDQSRRRTHGDVISPAAKRLSRQRTRCLVADAAYHRRPYFAGVLRARATSQPLATLRAIFTLPILFDLPPEPSSRQQSYHTPYGRRLQVLSQRFCRNFSAAVILLVFLRPQPPVNSKNRQSTRFPKHL